MRGDDIQQGRALPARAAAVGLLCTLAVILYGSVAHATQGVFSFDRLRLGGSTGAENYIYTSGDVIFPDGGADSGTFYKFVVTDSSGTVRNPSFPCTAASNFSSADNTYTIQAGDPVSNARPWRFTLNQYGDVACSGAVTKTAFKSVYVAKATTYADPALTITRTSFAAGGQAYVTAAGVKPGVSNWSTTWILPSLATACANTAGSERAESRSNGALPKNADTSLEYRPTTGGQGFNRESNYEVRPCQDFGLSNEGVWRLRLQGDATHFVVLTVFAVDATPPPAPTITSGPSDPSSSTSASFSFSDTEPGVGFLCKLDSGSFAGCSSPQSYSALGDGSHTFQLKAADAAGNDSAVASSTWTVDTTAPTITLSTPSNGSTTIDPTPPFTGTAGTGSGDSLTVTIKVYSGPSPAGPPVQTITTTRDGAGLFSVDASSPLADGTYTARAEQTDAAGNVGQSSASTFTVAVPVPPSNTAAPTISGTAQDGQTLTADSGTWSGTAPISYVYQWRRCDGSGSVCNDITGATAQTYTLVSGDVGVTIRALVTASNAGGSSSASSAQTAVVQAAPPQNTAAPTIAGPPVEGQTLTADAGTWSGTPPISYAYQWRRCNSSGNACNDITGATAQTHTLVSADVGATMRVLVTASNNAGSSSASSAQTAVVTDAASPPSNTAPPTISGTPVDGQALTADPGTWSGTQPISYAYQWRRCNSAGAACSNIAGASAQSYALTPADVDATIRVVVTAANLAGSSSATSAQTAVVTAGTSPPYRDVVLNDNPRGYWRLEETSGTTAADSSASNNPGAYSGGMTQGVPGALLEPSNAARLDGVDDRVIIGDPASGALDFGTGDFSVEIWLKTTVNGEQVAIAKQGLSDTYWQVTVTDDAGHVGQLRTKIYDGIVTRTAYGSTTRVDDGRWHHVVALFDRDSGTRIYVDGSSLFTGGPATGDISNTASFRIGFGAGYPYFNGDLDEAAVYATLLTDAQIEAHFRGGGDTAGPPVTLSDPANGAVINDTTPRFAGTGGTAVGDNPSIAVEIYGGTLPQGTPIQTLSATVGSGGSWSVDASAALAYGTYTAQASQSDGAGNTGLSQANVFTVSADPVIAAVGDIACDPASSSYNGGFGTSSSCRQRYTSDLVANAGYSAVLTLGDNQYECGGYNAFMQAYDSTWGRVRSITHPTLGNHEYVSGGGTDCDPTGHAGGYFAYFGSAAGDPSRGYYSFNLGSWHLIALNSNCGVVSCTAGSPQEQWLRADLAANSATCTLAYWHHSRFSSDTIGDNTAVAPLWQALYDAGADLVLSGHSHEYERFAPQNPSGSRDDASGIREIVAGTGGRNHSTFGTIRPNSEVRNASTYGVLRLALHPASYDWQFFPEAGYTFADSGSTACH
jgi:hypothetical protein